MSAPGPLARRRRPDAEHPAAADGERLRPGPIAQPVNTVSSAGYLVAAAVRWRRSGGARGRRRAAFDVAMCAAMAANGLGSIGFHGPGDRVSHRLHDTSLAAIAALLGADVLGTLVRRRASVRSLLGPGAVLGVGALVNAATRTGGPLARPDSLWQGHAAWHLLSAAALACWPRRVGHYGTRRIRTGSRRAAR